MRGQKEQSVCDHKATRLHACKNATFNIITLSSRLQLHCYNVPLFLHIVIAQQRVNTASLKSNL